MQCIHELLCVLLVDAEHHGLYPVVELGFGEHQFRRFASVEGEMGGAGSQVGVPESLPSFDGLHFSVSGTYVQHSVPEGEAEWIIAPDVPALAGNEQRRRHALDAHRAEVEGGLVARAGRRQRVVKEEVVPGTEFGKRLHVDLVDYSAPPVFPVKRFDYGGVFFLAAGEDEERRQGDGH